MLGTTEIALIVGAAILLFGVDKLPKLARSAGQAKKEFMVGQAEADIAVLISMGTRKSQVRRIFIAQGVLIGVVGTAIGLVLGYALSWAGGHYHLLSLAPEVYSIDYVPFAPRAIDGVLVALVAIGISLIATVYPSWSAARILPAEALRFE